VTKETGQSVPLSEVAKWEVTRGWAKINRRQKKQTVTVYADVNDKITTADQVISELLKTKLPAMKKRYTDIEYSFGGQYEENQKSVQSLILSFQYSFLSIFIILALFLRSYLQPLLIFAILPLGAIGAIFGHWLWNMPISIMSIFGIFGLCGILVNDALVLLHTINANIKSGMTVEDSLVEAGMSRFRAIVLTSITTFLGLLPLLFETSFLATPIIQMALSIGFGLLFGTFLTLFLMPALFWYLNSAKLFTRWITTGKWVTRESVEKK
jgi:multidrug efflux pump subunit AcrB